MEDALSEIRDNFFAGYYAKCLQLAAKAHSGVNDLEKAELFSITLRATAALNREKGATPGPSHTDATTVATVNFIDFWHADTKDQRKLHLDELLELAKTSDNVARFLASSALCKDGRDSNLPEALRLSTQGPAETELLRTAQMFLINRFDLAQQISKSMTSTNDDAVISKLASAAVSMMSDYQEAYLTYGDIQVQCCEGEETEGEASVLLLNGKAVANMERQHWDEALEDLQKSHRQDPECIDTISNLLTCCTWLKQEDEIQKYQSMLRELDPEHQTLVELNRIDQSFSKFRTIRQSA